MNFWLGRNITMCLCLAEAGQRTIMVEYKYLEDNQIWHSRQWFFLCNMRHRHQSGNDKVDIRNESNLEYVQICKYIFWCVQVTLDSGMIVVIFICIGYLFLVIALLFFVKNEWCDLLFRNMTVSFSNESNSRILRSLNIIQQ